jgi:hypothetical protein
MALLRSYGVSSVDSLTFLVEFEIPDNCNYSIKTVGTTYDICIELDPGQTQPSTDYKTYKENFVTTDGELDLQFKQTEGSIVYPKPKVIVSQP